MDGTTLNSKVMAGYAKAAQKIGTTYQHYRPSSANTPIAAGNRLADMPVSLNATDPTYSRPNVYGKAAWYAVADASLLQVGDYLVGAAGAVFVAALQQLLPLYVVGCNRTINVYRPQQQAGVGALGYGGDTMATETALMTAWPASVLQGSKGERGGVNLPGDTRDPWWQILLPAWPGVVLRSADIITDDLNRRYVISSAELTDLGWRLTAMQVQT